jgi:thymidylate kinase
MIAVAVREPAYAGAAPRTSQLDELLRRFGSADFALMGPEHAVRAWCIADDFHDLDIWVSRSTAGIVERALTDVGAVRLDRGALEPRLQHRQWWLPGCGRGSIVDVTVGDLRVGPLQLCAERSITTSIVVSDDPHEVLPYPRLTGRSAIVDLLIRPLLRGRVPEASRVDEARTAWRRLDVVDRHQACDDFTACLGRGLAADVAEVLDGEAPSDDLPRRARRRLSIASLRPSALGSTWAARHEIAGTDPGPFGLTARGALVAFVGTDGSGKTSLSERVERELAHLGYEVRREYLGMARSNLPGLATLRRLVRGPDDEALAPSTDAPAPTTSPSVVHTVGAWCYAVDYAFRSLFRLRPAVRRREVVLCDRWVTDLRRGPAPGSRASLAAERLAGRPQVMVLASAPAEVIVARKRERTLAQAAAEQAELALLTAEYDAFPDTIGLVADTSGAIDTVDPVDAIVRAIVAATHRSPSTN